jgi:FkbM family methyltransferase
LLDGLCEVTGFEPQPDALEALERRKGPRERYLPYAVGDGARHELRVCRTSGMTSLFEPDQAVLDHFEFLAPFGEVVSRVPIDTHRLDDLDELGTFDFLKIDIQGGELSVFRNGRTRLADAVVVQTEVSFICLYEGQPGFGEIDVELRSQGFVPHCFAAVKRWVIAPTVVHNDPRVPLNQLLEADIVYVRDFMRPERLTDDQLKHLCFIAHSCYGSYDLAERCIMLLEGRRAVRTGAQVSYVRGLAS